MRSVCVCVCVCVLLFVVSGGGCLLLVVVDHCSTWIHPVCLPPAPLLPLLTLPLPASLLPPFHSPSSFHLFLSCQVIHAVKTESPGSWKVLVVDDPALHILSACFKMPEVIEEGVTVVESINKLRKAIPDFHALYFCLPTKEVRTSFPPPLQHQIHLTHTTPVHR